MAASEVVGKADGTVVTLLTMGPLRTEAAERCGRAEVSDWACSHLREARTGPSSGCFRVALGAGSREESHCRGLKSRGEPQL